VDCGFILFSEHRYPAVLSSATSIESAEKSLKTAFNPADDDYVGAVELQGLAQFKLGQCDAALKALVSIEGQRGDDADYRWYRALAEICLGDDKGAREDLFKIIRIVRISATSNYVMWFLIEDRKSGGAPAIFKGLDNWTSQLQNLFTGSQTVDGLFAAIDHGDHEVEQRQLCQADFSVGEWNLLHQDITAARIYLNKTHQDCGVGSDEPIIASAELVRLGVK
jgi:hypothetical protein